MRRVAILIEVCGHGQRGQGRADREHARECLGRAGRTGAQQYPAPPAGALGRLVLRQDVADAAHRADRDRRVGLVQAAAQPRHGRLDGVRRDFVVERVDGSFQCFPAQHPAGMEQQRMPDAALALRAVDTRMGKVKPRRRRSCRTSKPSPSGSAKSSSSASYATSWSAASAPWTVGATSTANPSSARTAAGKADGFGLPSTISSRIGPLPHLVRAEIAFGNLQRSRLGHRTAVNNVAVQYHLPGLQLVQDRAMAFGLASDSHHAAKLGC